MSSSRAKGPFPLSELPNEIRQSVIYSYSTLKDLSFLAQTSKQYKAETTLSRLLSAAIHAVPRLLDAKEDENATALEAIDILKKHPELLFIKEQVKDHYGRDIFASPYQIFLGTCDIWALRQIQEDILPLITNEEAKAEAEAQFTEQFPRYLSWPLPQDFSEARLYDNRNELQIAEIKDQLAVVKDCIDGDPFNNNEPSDNTKAAVERLCNLFKPKPGEVIQSGLHFPLAIMQEIYKTYNTLESYWSFFSLAVIKPALDALSTVDGQCCQPLMDSVVSMA